MKFDVIVGNPPYQLSTGSTSAQATPLYHKFIHQAKKMNPRYLTMIIPARWYAGGRGLDDFREEMLHDTRIRKITDYFNSTDCFPGIDLSGGVCYFLWDRDNRGICEIQTIQGDKFSTMERALLEEDDDVFIRFNEAINIVRKVKQKQEKTFENNVSAAKPFGIGYQDTISKSPEINSIKIYAYPKDGYVDTSQITKNEKWINQYKVLIAKAYGERGHFPYMVLAKPFMGESGSCCSETYLVLGAFNSKKEAKSVISYISTRFCRFLVLLKKNTQHALRKVYSFVPVQNFSEPWTDEKLYAKYGLTQEEVAFIESMIRPMEVE
jgi:site-specific DNA-methyltransferase (adenine-specific)